RRAISVEKGRSRAFIRVCYGFSGFLWHLGGFVGSWTKIAGFLRHPATTSSERVRRVSKPSPIVSRLSILTYSIIAVGYFALIAYLRYASVTGTTQSYLYLEVGGTLISFCYAANALVRFRGTHDRTALILAFGFVLSGIIETVGYFALYD